jgi:hypothetical protein
LPSGWTGADFNAPTTPGGNTATNGVYTLAAGGTGIGGTSDQYHWAYRTFNADSISNVTTTARITSVSGGQAGVIIRGNLNAGSRMAAVTVSSTGEVRFIWRAEQGQAAQSVSAGTFTTPVWVRVVRQGNNMSGFVSTNGTNWTQIGTTRSIPISSTSYTGLVAASHNSSVLETSVFTNVNTTV